MNDKTPQEICESLLGLSISSIEIDTDDELIRFGMSNGQEIEFTGDGLEMYASNPPKDD
jgi:hypothetical protein